MKAQLHLEPIIPSMSHSFVTRRFLEKNFSHPYHYHPEIEITYIVRSKGTRIVGDHMGTFEAGDLCVIGENLPHFYRNTLAPPRGAESEVLHFSRNCAHGFLDSVPELDAFSDLLDRSRLGLRFDSRTARKAGKIIIAIRKSTGPPRWMHFMSLVSCLVEAPDPEELCSAGYARNVEGHLTDRIQRACRHILENFEQDLSHKEMAEIVHTSPAHFSRLFKRAMRKTFTDFLSEVRLGHACRLLVETELPIVEIAFNSGFRNLSNFNRRFLRSYHCNPRDYRKRHLVTSGDGHSS